MTFPNFHRFHTSPNQSIYLFNHCLKLFYRLSYINYLFYPQPIHFLHQSLLSQPQNASFLHFHLLQKSIISYLNPLLGSNFSQLATSRMKNKSKILVTKFSVNSLSNWSIYKTIQKQNYSIKHIQSLIKNILRVNTRPT